MMMNGRRGDRREMWGEVFDFSSQWRGKHCLHLWIKVWDCARPLLCHQGCALWEATGHGCRLLISFIEAFDSVFFTIPPSSQHGYPLQHSLDGPTASLQDQAAPSLPACLHYYAMHSCHPLGIPFVEKFPLAAFWSGVNWWENSYWVEQHLWQIKAVFSAGLYSIIQPELLLSRWNSNENRHFVTISGAKWHHKASSITNKEKESPYVDHFNTLSRSSLPLYLHFFSFSLLST